MPALAAEVAESARSPLAAHGAPGEHLQAATRFDLQEQPERRPAPEWLGLLRSAQALRGRPAERGPPAPGLVSALRALVRCAALESDSVLERREPVRCAAVESGSALERQEPVRCAAKAEAGSALEPAWLRPQAAAVMAPFSHAPFPFPVPAARQVPPAASEQQAALPSAVAELALDVQAEVPQAGGHAVAPRPAVAKAAQREAEPLEAPVAPVVLPWVLPSALA